MWTSKEWNQYQKDLKRSDIDTQIEQAKKYFIDKAKKYPQGVIPGVFMSFAVIKKRIPTINLE